MGQFTNTAQPTGANPLLQMLLQGIFASGRGQQGLGMGGAAPTYQAAGNNSGNAIPTAEQQYRPPSPLDPRNNPDVSWLNWLSRQQGVIPIDPQDPKAGLATQLGLPWVEYANGQFGQRHDGMPQSGVNLPPTRGYPTQPPMTVGSNPLLPPGGGYPIQPPLNAGPPMPPTQGYPMQPPLTVGGPFATPVQGDPRTGIPQPMNGGPAAGTFVGQPNPAQKAINAMNAGNPMKPKKFGVL